MICASAYADPGFVLSPTGQATGNTCQSYALGVALAFKRDPLFKVNTAAELRSVELGIREEIKKVSGTNDVSHDHIKQGFDAYTKGIYKLTFKDVTIPDVGSEAGRRSGITSAALVPANFLLGAVVKDVVLASATRIDANPYGSGHIFTVLGADGPPNSGQRLLILNSAVKVKDKTRNTCTDGVPDDPGPYTAELSWKSISDINFKPFGGKIRLWFVEKS